MSACVWQAQKHNGKRNTNVRLLHGCYNAAHAVRSHIPARLYGKIKNAAAGLVRPHSGIAYFALSSFGCPSIPRTRRVIMQICSSDALSSIFLISSLLSRQLASIDCLLVSIWIFLSIIKFIHKAFWQKIDYLTVWDHTIRQRAVKAACAVWAYFVPLAWPTLFPAWAQRAFSLLVGHSFLICGTHTLRMWEITRRLYCCVRASA